MRRRRCKEGLGFKFKFKSKAGDVLPEGTAKVADDVADAGKAADDVADAGKAADDVADAGKASFSGRKQNAWEKYLKRKENGR